MFRKLTFNSIIWLILGLVCIAIGAYLGWQYRRMLRFMFYFPLGLTLTGMFIFLVGMTNGFTDHSPTGRKLGKLAILTGLIGLPLLGYGMWFFPFR